MKKSLWIVAVGLCVMILAFSFVQAQNGPVFRIGVLDEDDGPITNGARLAVQELNAAGGVQGADGTFFRLELINQPINSENPLQQAVTTLSQASIIAVLGPLDNQSVMDGMPLLQSLNIPVLIPATGDTLFAAGNAGRLFRIRAAEVHQGRALATHLITDLRLSRITTVQIGAELETTASLVGFTTAIEALGVPAQATLQLQASADYAQLANQIVTSSTDIVVVYGNPADASQLYNRLLQAGYDGLFAYNQAEDRVFRTNALQLNGILATTTWSYTSEEDLSRRFRDQYIGLYGTVPSAVDAASYDAIAMLAAAINRPGELLTNLSQIGPLQGIQGILQPAQLGGGETTNQVAVIQLTEFGGEQIIARFAGSQRLSPDVPVVGIPTPLPAATATPDGVVVTIKQARQNVRSGPSIAYDVLGQLSQGEQARVIGANNDNTWVVISFRGLNGWLATYLLDVFGDLNTVPIIAAPPTPTPPPSPTAPPFADLQIAGAVAAPSPILVNQQFLVSVTIRNAGNVNAGQFAIAATFPPNNAYSAAVVPGLAAGQTTVATLSGVLSNTGCYAVTIVVDLNSEVNESEGENNNFFNFNYCVNKPILRQGSQTLNPGDTIDLEGNALQGDANWDGSGANLNALFSARLGIIPNVTLETVHWDLINPGTITQTTIPRTSLAPGMVIGIITADGNRGAMRVDDLPGNQIRVTFVVYQN